MASYGTYQELLAQAIVDEMVRRGVGLGGGGGSSGSSGDASAENQLTQIERITEVRDRLYGEFITKPSTSYFSDHSGAIETTAQYQIIPLVYASSVGYFLLQNTSSQDLWFNFGQVASTSSPSIKLSPGETFTMEGSHLFVTNPGVTIIGSLGQTFTCKVLYSGQVSAD